MSADAAIPVGFVGLGVMGGRMVARLIGAGTLCVYDPDGSGGRGATRPGRRWSRHRRAVADAAEVVMVSLPRPRVVDEVALGADGLAGGGAIEVYVDLSTTGVATAQAVAERAGGA